MKVYVTQGHEEGIGLEVFFKTALMISEPELKSITLLAFKISVLSTLRSMKLPFTIHDSYIEIAGIHITVQWLSHVDHSQSFTALTLGMKLSEVGGVLYTLPTSKDQFPAHAGHTEYFRDFYHRQDLGMFFSSPELQVLLLSDHVPIAQLSSYLSYELIHSRLKKAIKTLKEWQWPTRRILISGLNPHAGENGMLGREEERIKKSINSLRQEFNLDITGPYAGDTMLTEQKSKDDLLVYLFHDQGLGVFKATQGFIGSNITLGLPYPRFSPDHGTSFGLYGKNLADYRGCAFSLRQALQMLKKVSNGKNSSHQS